METPTPAPGPAPAAPTPPPIPMEAMRTDPIPQFTRSEPDRVVAPAPRREPQEFLTGKNLFRVGLGLLLLGLAFLLRYAIDQNWIGEGARIAAGLATSGVLVGLGLKISATRPTYGQLLQGGGVAGMYITTFAAHRLYGMMDVATTTALLGAISAVGIGLAIQAGSEQLAIASVLGAVFVPIVVGASVYIDVIDATYLAAVIGVAVALYHRNEWKLVFWITQGAAALVAFAGVFSALDRAPNGAQMLLGLMWLAFVAVPILGSRLGQVQDDFPAIFGTTVGSLSLGIASWVLWMDLGDHWGLVAAAAGLAIIHVGLAYEFRSKGNTELSDLQLVPASVFLAAAIVLAFEGQTVTLALAAEGFALAIAGRRIENSVMEYLGHGVYSISAARMILGMVIGGSSGDTPLLNGSAMARIVVIGLAFGLAAYYDRLGDQETDESITISYAVAGFVASLLFFWVELVSISQGYVSAAWGVMGVAAIVVGTIQARKMITKVGVATLFGVATKLFLVDLASVDRIWRIALFFGFGIALLIVGYWMSNDE